MPEIKVKQEEGQPEIVVEILAQSIVDIAAGMKRINASRLSNKALLILLSHDAHLPQYEVQKVLTALEDLEKTYCKARKK